MRTQQIARAAVLPAAAVLALAGGTAAVGEDPRPAPAGDHPGERPGNGGHPGPHSELVNESGPSAVALGLGAAALAAAVAVTVVRNRTPRAAALSRPAPPPPPAGPGSGRSRG